MYEQDENYKENEEYDGYEEEEEANFPNQPPDSTRS